MQWLKDGDLLCAIGIVSEAHETQVTYCKIDRAWIYARFPYYNRPFIHETRARVPGFCYFLDLRYYFD